MPSMTGRINHSEFEKQLLTFLFQLQKEAIQHERVGDIEESVLLRKWITRLRNEFDKFTLEYMGNSVRKPE